MKSGVPQRLAEDPEYREYVGIPSILKGTFEKLPVLPTRDMGYKIDEIIEMPNGRYERFF